MRAPVAKPVSLSAAEHAARDLGLEISSLTKIGVISAWRTLAKQIHPDTSKVPSADAASRLAGHYSSRVLLLRWLDEQPDADCPLCNGSGHIRVGCCGSQPCPHCAE